MLGVKNLHTQKLKKYGVPVLGVLAVAFVGTHLSLFSHAFTASASVEVEGGINNGGSLIADSTASGGQGFKFGSSANTSTQFVTRSGSELLLGGKRFRFAGANAYWLGLDDNIRDSSGNPTYPTAARVNNALAGAVAMHATVLRTHTLGISLGCSNCLEPSLGTFNDAAFQPIDYAVQQAGKNNLKLMIPLIDQWRYYHGGKWDFVHWAYGAGVSGVLDTSSDMSKNAGNTSGAGSEKALEAQFYTNPTIIGYYEAYISHILNHVNQYTGVALKDDPTVMAWETGNELFDAPTSWTQTIAAYIKHTVNAKQLVADGSAAGGNHDSNAALTAADVDIVGDHEYNYPSGLDTSWITTDAATAAQNNKAFIIGEYGWSLPGLSNFYSTIEANNNISGDMYWALLPYEENGTPEPHGTLNYGQDDVPVYYPGVDGTMNAAITAMTNHAKAMAGIVVPPPVITGAISGSTSVNDATTGTGSGQLNYSGSWIYSTGTAAKFESDDHYSDTSGDTMTFNFTGTRVQLFGAKDNHHGIGAFSIDGGTEKLGDYYATSRTDQTLIYDSGVLSQGTHTLKVRVTGTHSASSTDNVVTVDGIAYLP